MNPMNLKLSKSVQVLFRFVRKNHIFYKVTSSNLRHQWSCFKQLKVERFAERGFFHDHNFSSKYHIHNSSALCYDMKLYGRLKEKWA